MSARQWFIVACAVGIDFWLLVILAAERLLR